MTELILHHYDASPFTQRALRMLGIKRLAWHSVETPMMPPKQDLVALTGGYRGTPVLQIGADVYIDSQRIARELEARFPAPSLFPDGEDALAYAMVKWSDAFFRTTLHISIARTASAWPDAFRRDREYLFPDVDFAAVTRDVDHAKAQFRAHLGLINQRLADGRAFLDGRQPSLIDVHAHPFVWLARAYFPELAGTLCRGMDHVAPWEQRVAALGEGERSSMTADSALELARTSTPAAMQGVDPDDPLGLVAGEHVEVGPDDTRRGAVRGQLAALDWKEVAVRRTDPRVGEVVVHFPRLGYRVSRAEAVSG
jgi:glutathione S-transferase